MKKIVCSCFFLDGKLCVWDRMFCNLRNYSIMNVVEVCFPVYYHLVLFICLLFLCFETASLFLGRKQKS
jgi:hypothetical protein